MVGLDGAAVCAEVGQGGMLVHIREGVGSSPSSPIFACPGAHGVARNSAMSALISSQVQHPSPWFPYRPVAELPSRD